MCKIETKPYYSPELIEVAKAQFKQPFDHDICEVSGEIRYDGKKVRIVINVRDRWIQIGCTRVTFVAMDSLQAMCRRPDEIVIQS